MKKTHFVRIGCSSALIAAMWCAVPALAEGVPAGTLIENTATATFDDNGISRNVSSNTVALTVEEVLDVAVASTDNSPVAIAGTNTLHFTVTNTGNGPESFVLAADPANPTNDFNVTVTGIAIDQNGNGVYDDGTDILLPASGATPVLAADETVNILVMVTAPTDAADGEASQVNLLASAATGTGDPGDVFVDQGVNNGDAVVGGSGADDDASASLTAAVSSVTLTKSAIVSDPFGGTRPVPGATITYTIVAAVSGSGSVADLVVNDNIPAWSTYVAESMTLQTSTLTDAVDGDAGQANTSTIAVDLGTVPAGEIRTITFDVTIDAD